MRIACLRRASSFNVSVAITSVLEPAVGLGKTIRGSQPDFRENHGASATGTKR
jgi:hypothetical protein